MRSLHSQWQPSIDQFCTLSDSLQCSSAALTKTAFNGSLLHSLRQPSMIRATLTMPASAGSMRLSHCRSQWIIAAFTVPTFDGSVPHS